VDRNHLIHEAVKHLEQTFFTSTCICSRY